MQTEFECFLVEQGDDEQLRTRVAKLPAGELPQGNVTIAVEYSSLNFKDALAVQGNRGVISQLPHVPGIDCAGKVVECQDSRFQIGEDVLITGYEFGQKHWGGWSQLARVPEEWVVPLPTGLTSREAMILGTAGFTAGQSIMALQRNEVANTDGPIVVTGASGGVASLAIRMLDKLGYETVAVTGKRQQHDELLRLGATRVLTREEFLDDSSRPMLSGQWAGGVDTVGGELLTTLLRGTKYGGCVTACGLVAGADLTMTVYPFLLRGITLAGIASADCPYDRRQQLWELLSTRWKPENLGELVTEVGLGDLLEQVERIALGGVVGRVLVRP